MWLIFLDVTEAIVVLAPDQVANIKYHEKATIVTDKVGTSYMIRGSYHFGETFREALDHVRDIRVALMEQAALKDSKDHCCVCKKKLDEESGIVEVKDKGRMCKHCWEHAQEDLQNQSATGGDDK